VTANETAQQTQPLGDIHHYIYATKEFKPAHISCVSHVTWYSHDVQDILMKLVFWLHQSSHCTAWSHVIIGLYSRF